MRIYVCEDDDTWSFVIQELLELDGHIVHSSQKIPNTTSELLRFDLVVSDNKFRGEKRGLDFLKRIRSEGFGGHCILYTSFPSLDILVECTANDIFLFSKHIGISDAVSSVLLT